MAVLGVVVLGDCKNGDVSLCGDGVTAALLAASVPLSPCLTSLPGVGVSRARLGDAGSLTLRVNVSGSAATVSRLVLLLFVGKGVGVVHDVAFELSGMLM